MKPRVYFIVLLLIVPVQGSLISPISIAGFTPDAALAVVYIIGLLTTPREAIFAGMAIGLIQDINSAGIIGLTSLTRGLAGLFAGLLGKRVLNIASTSNIAFLGAFSLAEALLISLFMQVSYGAVPFFSMIFGYMLPQALYTGLFGTVVLQLISRWNIVTVLTRPTLSKEW